MKRTGLIRSLVIFSGLWTAAIVAPRFSALANTTNSPILFNRDIRPILSDTCFPCHGFDASTRKGDLRLDTAEGATTRIEGRQAVKPGDLAGSELWRRVTSTD
ncbi:MAG TPA: c-type cytochrome domain-containing protein, partial [Clostridia bacterium]|nr:c-type cytochrome domain-containing protein [Clostridia bacterium]